MPLPPIFLGESEKNTLDKIFGHFGPIFGILGLAKFQKIDFFQLKSIFSIKGPVTIEGLRGVVGVFWGCLDRVLSVY